MTVSDLPKFEPIPRCPKCGGTNTLYYYQADTGWSECVGRPCERIPLGEHQHLHVACLTCGFRWSSQCLDKLIDKPHDKPTEVHLQERTPNV